MGHRYEHFRLSASDFRVRCSQIVSYEVVEADVKIFRHFEHKLDVDSTAFHGGRKGCTGKCPDSLPARLCEMPGLPLVKLQVRLYHVWKFCQRYGNGKTCCSVFWQLICLVGLGVGAGDGRRATCDGRRASWACGLRGDGWATATYDERHSMGEPAAFAGGWMGDERLTMGVGLRPRGGWMGDERLRWGAGPAAFVGMDGRLATCDERHATCDWGLGLRPREGWWMGDERRATCDGGWACGLRGGGWATCDGRHAMGAGPAAFAGDEDGRHATLRCVTRKGILWDNIVPAPAAPIPY